MARCIIFDEMVACEAVDDRVFEIFCSDRVHTFRAESTADMLRCAVLACVCVCVNEVRSGERGLEAAAVDGTRCCFVFDTHQVGDRDLEAAQLCQRK